MSIREQFTKVGREPLWQFLVCGALLWAGLHYVRARDERYTIQLGSAQRQRIAATYTLEFGQAPTAEQLQRLIERYVREEIFWREGRALDLEQDDEIVRRRVIQKFEFLRTDLAVPDKPTQAMLAQWYAQHQANYALPERVAFAQIYFSPDRGGDAAAKARALKILRNIRDLPAASAPNLGDVFPGPAEVAPLSPEEAARLFGQSDLAAQLFKTPVGHWEGPFQSGYGWHLLYVTARLPTSTASLAEVHDRVFTDYLDSQRRLREQRDFERLKAKYRVVDEDPNP